MSPKLSFNDKLFENFLRLGIRPPRFVRCEPLSLSLSFIHTHTHTHTHTQRHTSLSLPPSLTMTHLSLSFTHTHTHTHTHVHTHTHTLNYTLTVNRKIWWRKKMFQLESTRCWNCIYCLLREVIWEMKNYLLLLFEDEKAPLDLSTSCIFCTFEKIHFLKIQALFLVV